ncbi:MAG: GHKL domain-containing protein [Sphingomonadales bacterium]|nr:GHKL domain-containing protein [Sphingomonadales bacterium]
MHKSLGALLAIGLAGLQFLAVLVVVSSSYVTSERALIQHARNLLRDVGINTIEHSKGFLSPAEGAAELAARLAQNRVIASDDPMALEQLLFQQLQIAPQFAGIYYGTEDGGFVYVMRSPGAAGPFRSKIITVSPEGARHVEFIWRDDDFQQVAHKVDPDDTFDPRKRPWYNRARQSRATIWTDPYIFFSSQQPGITLAAPVIRDTGAIHGVVGVDIEISMISHFLSRLNIGEHGRALIIHRNGDVIAHPDLEMIKTRSDDGTLRFVNITEFEDPIARAAFAPLLQDGEIRVSSETASQFTYQGASYVSTVMPIISDKLPWTIAVYAPENDFTAVIKQNRTTNIWIAAAVAAITGLVGLALAHYIHKPVRAFAVRSALISQGEIDPNEPLPNTYRELERANETLVQEIAARREQAAQIERLNRDLSHLARGHTMGQMAAGLAHEINQPLTAIAQNADTALFLLAQNPEKLGELPEILNEIERQSLRAGDIIRALRGFIRKDDDRRAPFDFVALVAQTLHLVQPQATEASVEIATDLPASLPPAEGNRIQIAQVLVNLLRNAIEAVATQTDPARPRRVILSARPQADLLRVTVTDTGPGIRPGLNLFAQFETTKPDGMGLGLSICRAIVEGSGGALWEDGEEGQGARFHFTLPLRRPAKPAGPVAPVRADALE